MKKPPRHAAPVPQDATPMDVDPAVPAPEASQSVATAVAAASPVTVATFDVLEASFLAAAATDESLPAPALTEVAFAGRSNVGKSSTMNALMQRRGLVRTSSTPGCTRGINLFHARTRGGLELHLVDLPGYGFAKRSKAERSVWGTLIESYLLTRPTLRVVLVIVDVRRGLEDDDRALIEFCAQPRPGNPTIVTRVVITKVDLLPKSKRKPAVAAIAAAAGCPVIGFSSVLGEKGALHGNGNGEGDGALGRYELWRSIARGVLEGR